MNAFYKSWKSYNACVKKRCQHQFFTLTCYGESRYGTVKYGYYMSKRKLIIYRNNQNDRRCNRSKVLHGTRYFWIVVGRLWFITLFHRADNKGLVLQLGSGSGQSKLRLCYDGTLKCGVLRRGKGGEGRNAISADDMHGSGSGSGSGYKQWATLVGQSHLTWHDNPQHSTGEPALSQREHLDKHWHWYEHWHWH